MADEYEAYEYEPEPETLYSRLLASLHHRRRALAAIAVLAVLAIGSSLLWQAVGDRVAADPRYRVTADSITATPPPKWIRSDVRAEALSRAGLEGGLSALAPPQQLEARLAEAFRFHPWVRSVGRISKSPPNRIQIELEYRVPLVAIGYATHPGRLLLADAEAVRLPERDLTDAELRNLPRVTLPATGDGVINRPLGEAWADARVRGAVAIVSGLGQAWWDLRLADILPSPSVEVRGNASFYTYELVSRGGTRITWGASPLDIAAGEPTFQDKLAQLATYLRTYGTLDSASQIDLRSPRINVVPRTAKETNTTDEVRTAQEQGNADAEVLK